MQIHALCKLTIGVPSAIKALLTSSAESRGGYTIKRRNVVTKTLLVMKLSMILILVGTLHVAARTSAQRVTYTAKNTELTAVLSAIHEQTGYVFFYDKEYLDGLHPISVSLQDATINEAVTLTLKNLPLEFEMQGNTIFISRTKKTILPPPAIPLPQANFIDTIRGIVIDSMGVPLSGASVLIKGTSRGSKTDLSGNFTISSDNTGATPITITYTGYESKDLIVPSDAYVTIILKRSESPLDEIVVQAYGTTSRRFSVGSISTVTAETIERQPVTNVMLALQGQAPGLAINATSGVPGSKVLIQVRGQNTLWSDPDMGMKPYDEPLIIIDGVPFAPQTKNINQLGTLAISQMASGGISTTGGISPLNNINPADIESISILKDADATSIYGTQGSNGVILITTKKAKPGKSTFNLRVNSGFNSPARRIKFLNTEQYLQYRKDAFATSGFEPTSDPFDPGFAPDLTLFDQTKHTDWYNTIYGKTSNNTDIHARLSGGSTENSYLLSAGYTRSTYNYPGNYADERLSLHGNIHHNSLNNRFSIDFTTDFGYNQNNSPGFGGGQKITLAPNIPDLVDADGNLVWDYKGVDLTNHQFYGFQKRNSSLRSYNLNNSLRTVYRIFPGLSFTANLGYNRNTTSEKEQNPAAAQNPLWAYSNASFAQNVFQTINIEPQLDYNFSSGHHSFTALLGATYKKNQMESTNMIGFDYTNDRFLGSLNGAGTIFGFDNFDIYKYVAGFARFNYIYAQKYIVSLTGRRDGSSNFGPGNEFGNFGSFGAGWIFTEETGIKTALPFINYGKLSGNYGTSGSDGIAAYKYQAFWQPINSVPSFIGFRPNMPINIYNPQYSWALKKSLNASLDLSFFKDKLLFNSTFYLNREGNQLGGYPLPAQAGFQTVLQNLPATVQNKGWEFSLSGSPLKSRDFTWTSNFNISFNRNKLIDFPNLEASPYRMSYIIGQPTSSIIGYRYAGVDQQTGLMTYLTSDGKITNRPAYGLTSQGGDMTLIGNREVKYMGGWGNTFTYRRFDLHLFFQFAKQNSPNYLLYLYSSSFPAEGLNNIPVEALDYWKKPGDRTSLQQLITAPETDPYFAALSFGTSSGAYTENTYLRLKTISLSYAFPDKWLQGTGMQNFRIYMNAQNLLTMTNFKVSDPEQFGDYTAFPIQRTLVFGLNVNF